MVNLLTSVKARQGFFLRAVLCILIPFSVSTAVDAALFYLDPSAAGTFGAKLLEWSYSAFYAMTVAAAYTLIVAAIYTKGPKGAAKVMLVYSLCRFAGESFEYFLEYGSGGAEIGSYEKIMSGVVHLSEFFAAVALAFGVWIMSSAFLRLYKTREGKRKYAVRSAVNFAILFEFSVAFARLIVRYGAGFFGSDLLPSVDAISTFVYAAVEVVAAYAILAFVASRISLSVCTEREF